MSLLAMLERRAHPASPDAWLLGHLNRSDNPAGVRVDHDTALSSTAVWAAVRVLASTLATVPLHLLRQEGRSKTPARDHPVYELLYRRPNPELSAVEWREMSGANVILTGNGYNETVWSGGYPSEIWPLWAHRVKPMRIGGGLFYRVDTGTETKYLPARQVLHFRGFSTGGLLGLDPTSTAEGAIALDMALEKYGSAFFGNAATPSGVLQHPAQLSKEAQDRLREALEDQSRGLDRAHRLMILEEGMQWSQRGVSPVDAQAIEARTFQLGEVARIFNVPPHIIKDLTRATFSNIEQQSIEFVRYSIRDWAVRLEQRMELSLLTEQDRADGYIIRHNLEGLLRGDLQSRYTAYSIGRQNGWLSPNDVREIEDLNPIEQEGGDDYHIQLNMVPLDMSREEAESEPVPAAFGQAPPEPEEEPEEEEGRSLAPGGVEIRSQKAAKWRHRQQEAYRSVLEDVARRVLTREVNAVRRAAGKYLGNRSVTDLKAWLEEFYRKQGPLVATAFLPHLLAYAALVLQAIQGELGGDGDMTEEMEEYVRDYAEQMGAEWSGISHDTLVRLLEDVSAEDLAALVEEKLDAWDETRAGKVAGLEATRVNGSFARFAYAAMGVTVLRWVTMGKPCPYCAKLNGRTASITGAFLQPGTTLEGDSERGPLTTKHLLTHPPLHNGCVCQLTAGI